MLENIVDLEYMSLEEAAQKLGLNKVTLEKAVERGELVAVKNVFRFTATTKEWLDAWLRSKAVNLPEQGER